MTREQCITDLKGIMDLYLFDPSTGETLRPEQLNDTDRMTYEAMKAAVGFIQGDQEEKEPQEEMHRFFYTFGTDPAYPYGENDFVEIRAKTELEADEKYRESIPNRPGSNLLNCAFVYTEDKWIGDGKNGIRDRYYRDREAARIIE